MRTLGPILVLSMTALLALPTAAANSPTKAEALAFVSGLKDQNTARLRETDQTISKKLDESRNTHQLANIEDQIEKLSVERRELLLRQDFLDRLTFQIDVNYPGKDLKEFLQSTLQGMAGIELRNNSEHSMWKFLHYLSLLIQNSPEHHDQVLALMEGYMKQTTIENPMRPDEYLAKIAYSNGHESEAAHPMDRGQIGAYVDKKLKAQNARVKTVTATPTIPTPTAIVAPAPSVATAAPAATTPASGPSSPPLPAAPASGQTSAPVAQ